MVSGDREETFFLLVLFDFFIIQLGSPILPLSATGGCGKWFTTDAAIKAMLKMNCLNEFHFNPRFAGDWPRPRRFRFHDYFLMRVIGVPVVINCTSNHGVGAVCSLVTVMVAWPVGMI